MATLIINRIQQGLFTHELDGVQSAIDNRPALTSFTEVDNGQSVMHFKTKNGAPLVKNQNIRPQEITITDTFGGTPDQTGFTNPVAVWLALGNLGYFEGFSGSGGGEGIDTFKNLLDVFPNSFQYKNGMVYVVNEADNRLEPVEFFNYSFLTQMSDVEGTPISDIPNGYVLTVISILDGNGVSQKLAGFRPQSIMSQVPNGFLTIGTYSLEDGVFTADTAWTWSQDGVEYGNLETFVNEIDSLPVGSSRFIDYHTMPDSNSFDVTLGPISTDGNAVNPTIPLNSLLLKRVFVNGTEISEVPGEPIIGGQYVTKSSYGWTQSNISGENATIIYQSDANAFELINPALVSIDSVAVSIEDSYNGQQVWILNKTGNSITLNNNASGGLATFLPFIFLEGQDMTVANNGLVRFKRKDNEMLFESYSIGDEYSVPTLDEVAQVSSNKMTEKIKQELPGYPSSTATIGFETNGGIKASHNINSSNYIVANLGFSGGNISFSFNSPNFSNGVPISGIPSTNANKIIYYSNSDGTPVPTTFSGRQIPDANWINTGLALKANDADVLHKTGNEVKNGSLTVNSLLMVTPQMRIGNDSGYLQWIGLTNDLSDRRFTFESDPGVSGGKNFFIYAGGQLIQTWLESKTAFAKPVELGKYTNGTEPALIVGAVYFNTSINKMKIGGATGWECLNNGKVTINPSSGTVFNIPHGLGVVPKSTFINFSSYGSLELREYNKTVNATNITITFLNTPMETTLDIDWQAIQ